MKHINHIAIIAAASAFALESASAHTTYGGTARNLGPNVETSPGSGTFVPGAISGATSATPYFKTITNQTVTSDYGWAHGTDADFGDAHHIRAFRFTLAEAGWATISVAAAPSRGSASALGPVSIIPAFSLYSGLLSTGSADYDTAPITVAYLETLGNPQPREGAFNALGDWKMGNDASVADEFENFNFDELSSLTYIGNAADGTSANFGSAAGINGDGVADGFVQGSFMLPAGSYTIIIGGADINGANGLTFGIDASLSVIPEPSCVFLASLAGFSFVLRRRRH